MEFILTAVSAGEEIASTTLVKQVLLEGVERLEVDTGSVCGVLFSPASVQSAPGVVLIPGSTGLQALEMMASLLANHGYAVLLVGYYRYKSLPDELYELPLERFKHAIEWLAGHDKVTKGGVSAIGISKGAEGLLATASYCPDIPLKHLIGISASNVIWQGIGKGRPEQKSSWSLFGEPLPYLPMHAGSAFMEVMKRKTLQNFGLGKLWPKCEAVSFKRAYEKALKGNKKLVEQAEIPAENIKVPITLFIGEDDALWPVKLMTQRLMARLAAKNFQYLTDCYSYPGVGHVFMPPGVPSLLSVKLPHLCLALGGDRAASGKAYLDYWNNLLAALKG